MVVPFLDDCHVLQFSYIAPCIWLLQMQYPLPTARCSNLRPVGATVSGYMDCVHSAQGSVTYLSTPRLMATDMYLGAVPSMVSINFGVVDGPEDGVISQVWCLEIEQL